MVQNTTTKYNNVQSAYKNHGNIKVPGLIQIYNATTKIHSTKRDRRKSDDTLSSFTANRRSYAGRRSTHVLQAIRRPKALRDACPPSIDDPSGRPNRQTVQTSSTILEHATRLPDTGRRAATTRPLRHDVELRSTDR